MRLAPFACLTLLAACGDGPATNGQSDDPPPSALSSPQSSLRTTAPDGRPLVDAIRAYLRDGSALSGEATFKTAWSDLNGDGKDEAIVYLVDDGLCGSGGCQLFVLSGDDRRWTVIDKIGPAQLPIYRLRRGEDGWAGLGVTVAGGGLRKSLMNVPHDAEGYADNPTVAPARPTGIEGATLLLASD